MQKKTYLERIEEEVAKAGSKQNPTQGMIAVMWIMIEWMKEMQSDINNLQDWNTTTSQQRNIMD